MVIVLFGVSTFYFIVEMAVIITASSDSNYVKSLLALFSLKEFDAYLAAHIPNKLTNKRIIFNISV
jgi:hypothetical protein